MHISTAARPARFVVVITALALVIGMLPFLTARAEAATPTAYAGHTYTGAATAASADKPQSKLWYNAGSWWALMVNSAGTEIHIFELQSNHTWRDTGTVVDDRETSTGDALWSGSNNRLYVVSRTATTTGIRTYRFTFDPASRTYTRDSSFPSTIPGAGTESASIDMDSTGALWATFTRSNSVWWTKTDSAQTRWSAPAHINGADADVNADDISAVVAFQGRIGIMWSDQDSDATRFAYHQDGAPDDQWTVETPLAGTNVSDDHLNLKTLLADGTGRVYAAVKTSFTAAGDPIIYVMRRSSNGTWTVSEGAKVSDNVTRPQIALDETNRELYLLQSTEAGGTAYFKSTSMDGSLSFPTGPGSTLIGFSGARINNVSTTKDPVNSRTGLVVIATDEFARRYYHAEMPLGGGDTTAPPAPSLSPGAGTYTGSQSVSMSSEAGATIRYTVSAGTTSPADPTTTSTLYSGPVTVSSSSVIKARAYDAAGNASPVTTASYTINPAPGGGTRTVVLTPTDDTMAKQSSPSSNYGGTTPLEVDGQETSGTSSSVASYLQFRVPVLASGETVTGASLSLQMANGTSNGPSLYPTATGWTEGSITYSNPPAVTSTTALGNFGSMGATGRVSTTISGSFPSGQAVSYQLRPDSTDGMAFASSENTTGTPQLTLTITTS